MFIENCKKADQVKDQVNFLDEKPDQVKIRSIKHQDHRSSSGKVQFRYTSLHTTHVTNTSTL
jgi:hypothetical protein